VRGLQCAVLYLCEYGFYAQYTCPHALVSSWMKVQGAADS